MPRALLAAALMAVVSIPAHAEMTNREAAERLSQSVVEMRMGSNQVCTAAKVGARQYLTARHCIEMLRDNFEIKQGFVYQTPTSVQVALSDGDDWAVLNVDDEEPEIVALPYSCTEEIYMGMPVAYLGYPDPANPAFSVGYVSSVNETRDRRMDSDFVIDVQASHGASGAPVMSLDTGHIIGVLIEGVQGGAGFFLVGVQAVKDTPLCPDDRPRLEPFPAGTMMP